MLNIKGCAASAKLAAICLYLIQEQQQDSTSSGKTSQEDDKFWQPADNVNELYKQMCSKKYREIVRQQVE